jgi:hypothetical protein
MYHFSSLWVFWWRDLHYGEIIVSYHQQFHSIFKGKDVHRSVGGGLLACPIPIALSGTDLDYGTYVLWSWANWLEYLGNARSLVVITESKVDKVQEPKWTCSRNLMYLRSSGESDLVKSCPAQSGTYHSHLNANASLSRYWCIPHNATRSVRVSKDYLQNI